jgi:hypothetical protein|tara:strand:+ start:1651 stop:1980 length:330 start_codon:yes stop_codon:yes gene_type:complete
VPPDGDSQFKWDGQTALWKWHVARVTQSRSAEPSPAMTRKLRSVFQIHASVFDLGLSLGDDENLDDEHDDENLGLIADNGTLDTLDDAQDEENDRGRWADEGAFDRPWH